MTQTNESNPFGIWDQSANKNRLAGINTTPKVAGETQANTQDESEDDTQNENSLQSQNAPTPAEQGLSAEEQVKLERKRYADLQSFKDKQINELKQQLNKQNKSLPLPKTPEELDQFKKDNPEAYDIFVSLAAMQNKTLHDEIEANKAELEEIKKEKIRMELLAVHPDAMTLRYDPKFVQWLSEQSFDFQNIIENGTDAKALAGVFNLFKYETRTKTKTKQNTIDATRTVETGGLAMPEGQQKKIWKASEINSKVFAKYEAEIEQARREGRFVQDI